MKKKLTETYLHKVIKEAIENTVDDRIGYEDSTIERIERCKETLGADDFIYSIIGYIGEFAAKKMLDSIERKYGLNCYDEDEEDY